MRFPSTSRSFSSATSLPANGSATRRDQPQGTAAAIENAIASGNERTIRLTTPRPVYVLYWTAWVSDDGHMEFHRDHYERDAALAAALQ